MNYDVLGPVAALILSMIGSAIGCAVAGKTSHAVMSRTEEGHGKYIGMSAMPSSQGIYGFILMLLMKNAISEGRLSAMGGSCIGIGVGLVLMVSAIYQGTCCSSGIQASAKSPAVYGKCFAAIGIVESFALFAFVFSLLLM